MATLEQLQQALIAADKAGASDDAKMLAQAIVNLRQSAPVRQAEKQTPDDPGAGMSTLIGAGRTFDRVGKGMQQLFYGATGQDDKAAALKAAAAEDDRLYQPLKDARPWATGIGESLPSLAIPGGGGATLGANALRMAAAGAIPGVLEYGSAGERAGRAALGAAAGAAVPGLVGVARSAKSFAEPLYQGGREAIAGRLLNRVTEGSSPQVVARLRAAQELVPGSAPTAGQVAESGGIAALERAAAQANPEAYTARAMDQASARMNALRGVAGDDAQMAAAVAARDAASKSLYATADSGMAPIDGMFKGLSMRPQFKAAVARAQELAQDGGLADIFFRNAKGEPTALIGEGAHLIKKALDEAGEHGAKSYTGKAGAAAANRTNEAFQAWLDKSIPEYAAAKVAFAEKSAPINQMQIGKALMDKAAPALADFGALGRETGATYATAMRNGDALAEKATGFSGAKMDKVLTPQQMQAVEGVAKDLARKANAQDLGRGVGSDTFQKLAMSNIAEQSGMPRMMGGLLSLPGVSRATRWLYQDADQQMQGLLADTLLNPSKTAGLMTKAQQKLLAQNPKSRQALEQALLRTGLLGAPAAYSVAD